MTTAALSAEIQGVPSPLSLLEKGNEEPPLPWRVRFDFKVAGICVLPWPWRRFQLNSKGFLYPSLSWRREPLYPSLSWRRELKNHRFLRFDFEVAGICVLPWPWRRFRLNSKGFFHPSLSWRKELKNHRFLELLENTTDAGASLNSIDHLGMESTRESSTLEGPDNSSTFPQISAD